ncbi:MAG: hypothetical protein JWL98_1331 [Xanthomonadaceae bacterium]|nr:hypothetical protein [Xanthomonadaceae bacterium]
MTHPNPTFTSRARSAVCCMWLLGFSPLVAHAACDRWDVSGQWRAVQANDTSPQFTLQQTTTGLQGTASYTYVHKSQCVLVACGDDYYTVNGSVDGTVDGDAFKVNAYWDNGTIGVYTGTINPQGRIEGVTYDRQHPDTKASWYSDRTLTCAATPSGAAVATTTPPPDASSGSDKPPIALGRVTAPGKASRWTTTRAVAINNGVGSNAVRAAGMVVAAPTADVAPVRAPDDLVIGRMTYAQGDQIGTVLRVGVPVSIRCMYSVTRSSNAFTHMEPWQGEVTIGGAAPQTLEFQGSAEAGQHDAQVTWTPGASGQTPVTCAINPKYARAETYPDNNRWTDTVDVVDSTTPVAP